MVRAGAALRYSVARGLVLLLFFLSGVSALIYEVSWVRLLSLSFGVSVYAVSAVLTAFMGGLALGAWIFGRITNVPRFGKQEVAPLESSGSDAPIRRLFWLYAALQIGIALCAFVTPFVFDQLTNLYVWLEHSASLGRGANYAIRLGFAILALLLPTLLMGGTLPVMGQLLARRNSERGSELGALYAANTCGAVVGALLAGLLAIRFLGVDLTIYLAAVIDIVVAGVALWMSRRQIAFPLQRQLQTTNKSILKSIAPAESQPAASGGRKIERQKRRQQTAEPAPVVNPPVVHTPVLFRTTQSLVLAGFALSGFVSLAYQVVWTRLLAIFSLNAVYSFTVMLATFLIGLAVGGALAARRVDRVRNPLMLFGTLQLAIGVCGVLVLYVFAKLPSLLEAFTRSDTYGAAIVTEFFAAAVTMLVPTLLIGATFPVAARVYTTSNDPPEQVTGQSTGERLGRLYALNTLGAMLGSFVAGFVLIPTLGLQRSALVLATLNLAIGALALLSLPQIPKLRLGGTIGVALVGALLLPPGIYLGFREGATPQLKYYHEGIDATVAVFEVAQPPLKISFVNGRSEVPTDAQSMRAFYLLGHLPPLLRPNAQSALMVSFGNGIATGAMSRHSIPRIQAVELVAEQVEAAKLYRTENRGVLDYPGLAITNEDGRNFLLRSPERYDIITADATHPINSSSWALFTHEFYTLVRGHLADDGVFVQWLPFHDLSERDYRNIVKTFQSVFPHTTIFYTGGIHTFLVATPQPLTKADIAALDARIKQANITDDLGDGEKLAADLLMEEAGVQAYTAGAGVVTDDRAFFIPAQNVDQILEGFAPFVAR